MTGIITITFSPCIDKTATVGRLIPEKKLKCGIPTLEPGGGGINVARAIKRLGGEATAIYPSGGYTGKHFEKLMQDEDIPSIIIETKNETRENIIIFEKLTSHQYRFGMPGNTMDESEWKLLLKAIDEIDNIRFIVASGSLPPGVPENILASITEIAKRKKAKLIADTSGKALKYAIQKGVFLLKPNLGELASLVDTDYLKPGEIVDAAMQIINKGNCEIIVVSMGSAGALLATRDIIKRITPPPVEKKSTVGAGDSMVAGIVYALSKEKNIEEAVQYGVASGTAATMNPGTELCKLQDVEKLYPEITVEENNFS